MINPRDLSVRADNARGTYARRIKGPSVCMNSLMKMLGCIKAVAKVRGKPTGDIAQSSGTELPGIVRSIVARGRRRVRG
jgi:hypothetical protein